MDDEIDPNVIKATQISLGKYVKRPPLSDKLLRKPPFRFLHDIVTSVLKSKGFFNGLFDENELNSDNVKDRDSKILFLNKVISVVSLTTGQPLSVKPSKIVAGQEATKTNELLQCLAQALDKNLSSDEAVKKIKSGTKISPSSDNKNKKEPAKLVKRNIESKKFASKSSEKLVSNEKDGQALSKPKQKENIILKKESPPKKTLSKISHKKPPEKSNQEVKQKDNIEINNKISSNKKPISKNVAMEDNERKNTLANENTEQSKILLGEDTDSLDIKSSSNENILESDIKLKEDLSDNTMSNDEKQVADMNESTLKPDSANKPKPKHMNAFKIEEEMKKGTNMDSLLINTDNHETKIDFEQNKNNSTLDEKDTDVTEMKEESEESNISSDRKELNNSTTIRPTSVRPSSSRPGAPRVRDKSDNIMSDTENIIVGKVNIISENTLHEEEEDMSIIVENQITEELHGMSDNQESNSLVNNQNSHLVQQILDSQKEFSQTTGKTEIEWQFGAQKAQDVFIQEMEQLRFSVQALSRIANPLGKLLDHIQEDVEVMRQELQQWTILYEETSKDLLKQKTANEESVIPFHTKLKQLNTDIGEKTEKITDLKVSIHKNASRIEKLLANGMVQ